MPANLIEPTSDERAASEFARLAPVASAVEFLVAAAEAGNAPSLEETADHCGLSPAHFQRMFRAGTGVSPKRFLQYLAAGRAGAALRGGMPVFEAALEAGLSGPSRLHDLMVHAEAMPPGSVRRRGAGETVRHALIPGPCGMMLIGATARGLCWLSFETPQTPDRGLAELRETYPAATFVNDEPGLSAMAADICAFVSGENHRRPGLHVQGTNFQLQVWQALLAIPEGQTTTYGALAKALGMPKASRAVGSAVGANPISVLIPCHRVIRASGAVQNYRWGPARKDMLLAMEAARTIDGLNA